jgi:hypothetical protein
MAESGSIADEREASRRAGAPPSAEPLPVPGDAPDLLHGGVLYRVMRRFGVEPDDAARAARRGTIAALVLWGPMFAMALLDGTAFPGLVRVPLLLDVAAYVRPLVTVPLLLASEPILATAWRTAGARLRERGIVGPDCREAYDALVVRTTRAVRRLVPEILCFAIAAFLVVRLLSTVLSAPRDAWFARADASGSTRLTVAGVWAGVVVHGLLFYLSLRWLWLLSLWYRFLFGVSRLPLHLYPAHPDRAGGLGLIGWSVAAGAPLIFAWSAALASAVANHVLYQGESLKSFLPVGAVFLGFVLVVFVLPPAVVFVPMLARARLRAIEQWSRRLARSAEGEAADPAPGARAPAVTSLEEIHIAVTAVRAMRPFPIAPAQLVGPLVAAALPVVPLLFLAFSASEIFRKMVDLVL